MDHSSPTHGTTNSSSTSSAGTKQQNGNGEQVNLPTPEMSPLENGTDRESHVGSSTAAGLAGVEDQHQQHQQLLNRLTGNGMNGISTGMKGNPVMQLISKFDSKRPSPYAPRNSPFAQFHAAAAAAAAAGQQVLPGSNSPTGSSANIQHSNQNPAFSQANGVGNGNGTHQHLGSPISDYVPNQPQQTGFSRQMEFYDNPNNHQGMSISAGAPPPAYFQDQYGGAWIPSENGDHHHHGSYSPQHRIAYDGIDGMQTSNGMYHHHAHLNHHYGYQNDHQHHQHQGYPAMDANHNSFYACGIKSEPEGYDTSSPDGIRSHNNNNNTKGSVAISINNNHSHDFEHHSAAVVVAATGASGSTNTSSSLIYKALSEACDGAM